MEVSKRWQLGGLAAFIAGILGIRFGKQHSLWLQIAGLTLVALSLVCFLMMQRIYKAEIRRTRRLRGLQSTAPKAGVPEDPNRGADVGRDELPDRRSDMSPGSAAEAGNDGGETR